MMPVQNKAQRIKVEVCFESGFGKPDMLGIDDMYR